MDRVTQTGKGEMLVRIRLATKASAEVRGRDNKLYTILIPNLMIDGRAAGD
jgi:hypothetical protein